MSNEKMPTIDIEVDYESVFLYLSDPRSLQDWNPDFTDFMVKDNGHYAGICNWRVCEVWTVADPESGFITWKISWADGKVDSIDGMVKRIPRGANFKFLTKPFSKYRMDTLLAIIRTTLEKSMK